MGFLERSLEAIPRVASDPFAFLAYALAALAWLWVAHRTARLKILARLRLQPTDA